MSERSDKGDFVMATEEEYGLLAAALCTVPEAYNLVMKNGLCAGWRSNQHVYVSAGVFKAITGHFPRRYDSEVHRIF